MKTMCIDTATKYIAIGLIEDDVIKASIQEASIRRQSEDTMPLLKSLLASIGWQLKEIDQVVLTIGPGSYTGVRIAMTIAKTMATVKPGIKLYTLSSLQMLCGLKPHCLSIIDARSKKGFIGQYHQGHQVVLEQLMSLDDIQLIKDYEVIVGDLGLLDMPGENIDIIQNMIDLKAFWQPTESVHTLVPVYLKEVEAKKL